MMKNTLSLRVRDLKILVELYKQYQLKPQSQAMSIEIIKMNSFNCYNQQISKYNALPKTLCTKDFHNIEC